MADVRDLRKLLNTKQDVIDFKGTPSTGGMAEGQIALSQSSGGQLAIHRKKYGKLWKSYMSYNGDQYVDRNLSVNGGLVIGGTRTERNQPAFCCWNSGHDLIAVDGWTTVDFNNEAFDVGGNFASDTFTAPVKGLYFLTTQVTFLAMDTDSTGYRVNLQTSNRGFTVYLDTDKYLNADASGWHSVTPITSVCDMDAGDTAYVRVYQTGGGSQTYVVGHVSAMLTWFSGYLLG